MAGRFFSNANKVKNAATAINAASDGGAKNITEEWIPGTAGNTTSTVEISISCRNLADKDILSKSDPMCVMYNRPPGSKSWVQFMRTEVIQNDLNPDFVGKATMEYRFEQVQALRFEVYDIDSETVKLSKQDTIGTVEVTLGQIVSAGEEGLTLELIALKSILADANKSAGTIILTAEEVAAEKDEVTLKLGGNSIGSWSGCLPPKSFFSLSKVNDAGKYLVVHRSRASRGSNPTYHPIKISCQNLCSGDLDRELKIEVYQMKISGNIVSVGSTLVTLNKVLHLATMQPPEKIQLMTPTGQSCNSFVKVLACTKQPINTFVDYIQAGTQIQCCFAIDFTCSNGDPTDQESLHYVSTASNLPNPYEQAIQAVGNILRDYDTTCQFPTWGFGARIPPKGDISHNFFVTLTKSPNCCSVPGVLEAYRSCISKIQLFGPTNFSPVINTVAGIASKSKAGESYYILVIITDGVITDMAKTKKAIVSASSFPLSIIIIGVGEADFDAMEELDGDAVRIVHKGKAAERDIVQFVAYRSARSWMASTGESTITENMIIQETATTAADGAPPPEGGAPPPPPPPKEETPAKIVIHAAPEDKETRTQRLAQSQLAQEVLAEIPVQLTGFMKSKGILPNMITKQSGQPAPTEGGGAAAAAAAITEEAPAP